MSQTTRIVFDCPSEIAAAVSRAAEGSPSRTAWIIRALEAVLEAEGFAPASHDSGPSITLLRERLGSAPTREQVEAEIELCERVRRAWRLDARKSPALAILRALAEDRVPV